LKSFYAPVSEKTRRIAQDASFGFLVFGLCEAESSFAASMANRFEEG
jgi:hypothetical protein